MPRGVRREAPGQVVGNAIHVMCPTEAVAPLLTPRQCRHDVQERQSK